MAGRPASYDHLDDTRAWYRLGLAVLLSTLGGVGMWSVAVVLPAVQKDFGVDRAAASLPYTATMIGFALGGVAMGRLGDRFGIVVPLFIGALALTAGYGAAASAPTLTVFALAYVLVGFGASASFAPLMADLSHWFQRRRGVAIGIAATGNYLAGAVWPPILTALVVSHGWRTAHAVVAVVCLVTLVPMAFAMWWNGRTVPVAAAGTVSVNRRDLGISSGRLQLVLCVAGFACCVAMAMPQVHIVAYCGDLGYGVAQGATMLSLMLACGMVSRVASGFFADRFGGLATLLLSSALQGTALVLYLFVDSLAGLYVVSALFGLFQGGLVPSYAIIVREYMAPKEAGQRLGLIIMATLFGMAFGGWASGLVFDATGSYRMAFLHGLGWNLVNMAIAIWLILRTREKVGGQLVKA